MRKKIGARVRVRSWHLRSALKRLLQTQVKEWAIHVRVGSGLKDSGELIKKS